MTGAIPAVQRAGTCVGAAYGQASSEAKRAAGLPPGLERYHERDRIERLVSRLKQYRRIATRRDKRAAGYGGFIALAVIHLALTASGGNLQRRMPTVSRYSRGTQIPSSVRKPSWKAIKSRRRSARRLLSRLFASAFVGP